jgi:hypothetical protein
MDSRVQSGQHAERNTSVTEVAAERPLARSMEGKRLLAPAQRAMAPPPMRKGPERLVNFGGREAFFAIYGNPCGHRHYRSHSLLKTLS